LIGLNKLKAKELIKAFLIEDINTGDLSAELIFDDKARGSGFFVAKDDGIICGMDIISMVYEVFGDRVDVETFVEDGQRVSSGDKIAMVTGKVRTVLSCERVILNLLQRMSGIASCTSRAIELLGDSSIKICDTRKTTPGIRMFEKYAVTCGGGFNHRIGLYDGIMLKDNHIAFAGGITNAVKTVRSKVGHMIKIEVETESKEQVIEAAEAGADIIMFDNRTPSEIKKLVGIVPRHIITEASGGIGFDNIADFRGCGVDYISMGAITHSAVTLDISFNSTDSGKV